MTDHTRGLDSAPLLARSDLSQTDVGPSAFKGGRERAAVKEEVPLTKATNLAEQKFMEQVVSPEPIRSPPLLHVKRQPPDAGKTVLLLPHSFRRVKAKDKADKVVANGGAASANAARGPDYKSQSVLRRVTANLLALYRRCNPDFAYSPNSPFRRVLTNPSERVGNNGFDNAHSNLIISVGDVLHTETGPFQSFRVLDSLGEGTFGQVVRCEDCENKRLVAVKVIKNKPAYYNQALMEIRILQTLNDTYDPDGKHNTLRMTKHFIFKRHLCLIFELLSCNLYEMIKQNQFRGFPCCWIRIFLSQLLSTMKILKQARIIHCDLKPENVLLVRKNESDIKLIDYGSACIEGQTVYSYIQSRFYRSPEALLGLPYDCGIDMWSLGCICAELFLGLPIFPGVNQYNQVYRIVNMIGMPPLSMLQRGKQVNKFFNATRTGSYELKTGEQYAKENGCDPVVNKIYFKGRNLRELVELYPLPNDQEQRAQELEARECFLHFLCGLLRWDPAERWTPHQAARHPFITQQPFANFGAEAFELLRFEPVPDPLPASNDSVMAELVKTALSNQQRALAANASAAANVSAALSAAQSLHRRPSAAELVPLATVSASSASSVSASASSALFANNSSASSRSNNNIGIAPPAFGNELTPEHQRLVSPTNRNRPNTQMPGPVMNRRDSTGSLQQLNQLQQFQMQYQQQQRQQPQMQQRRDRAYSLDYSRLQHLQNFAFQQQQQQQQHRSAFGLPVYAVEPAFHPPGLIPGLHQGLPAGFTPQQTPMQAPSQGQLPSALSLGPSLAYNMQMNSSPVMNMQQDMHNYGTDGDSTAFTFLQMQRQSDGDSSAQQHSFSSPSGTNFGRAPMSSADMSHHYQSPSFSINPNAAINMNAGVPPVSPPVGNMSVTSSADSPWRGHMKVLAPRRSSGVGQSLMPSPSAMLHQQLLRQQQLPQQQQQQQQQQLQQQQLLLLQQQQQQQQFNPGVDASPPHHYGSALTDSRRLSFSQVDLSPMSSSPLTTMAGSHGSQGLFIDPSSHLIGSPQQAAFSPLTSTPPTGSSFGARFGSRTSSSGHLHINTANSGNSSPYNTRSTRIQVFGGAPRQASYQSPHVHRRPSQSHNPMQHQNFMEMCTPVSPNMPAVYNLEEMQYQMQFQAPRHAQQQQQQQQQPRSRSNSDAV